MIGYHYDLCEILHHYYSTTVESPVETGIVSDHPLLCSLSPSYAITKTEAEIKIGLPVVDPLTYTFRIMTCTPANPDSL